MIPLHLAYEDYLTGKVVDRLILETGSRFAVGSRFSRGGVDYISRTVPGFNHAAKGCPFLVVADLDRWTCPRELIDSWLVAPQHPNLVVCIACREVESWLLADRRGFSRFLGVPMVRLPLDADAVPDPKQLVVNLARASRFAGVTASIVPPRGTARSIGPDYNGRLSEFVADAWDPEVAAAHSRSLARTMERLRTFTPTW